MSKQQYTHAMLLAMQLASVFKHVDDLGIRRETYQNFTQLEGEHDDIIRISYDEGTRKGRSYVEAIVNSDRNSFRFRQRFNFGILLELEIDYLHSEGGYRSLLETIKDDTIDAGYRTELIFDFEYCISLFTEHVASNLNKD
ncbi:hypothetical protein ST201phi2-1p364 [Pseudomonas phage 201phi2-1]|uniref:Uncharacterized protein n=1 Tax=Pseudomonas phage 201phi2-1 TaxID=198110 RepID=B3FJM4_BP201|nr:hypothetical protein ST201phi2-1p364 [Pseudomonas phage 201phi2-1]ABY63189.1 hypothetical protein 201phi2-1p364 [Pseudomonas phage 201phi2-1]